MKLSRYFLTIVKPLQTLELTGLVVSFLHGYEQPKINIINIRFSAFLRAVRVSEVVNPPYSTKIFNQLFSTSACLPKIGTPNIGILYPIPNRVESEVYTL